MVGFCSANMKSFLKVMYSIIGNKYNASMSVKTIHCNEVGLAKFH